MAMNEATKRKVLYIVLVILLIVLLLLLWLIYAQLKEAKNQVGTSERASETPTLSATASANVAISYDLSDEDQDIDSVKDVANRFMQAKEDRSYDEATPFMSDDLKGKWDQNSFAGASSPSMDRFEITDTVKVDDDTYNVSVTSFWLLQAEAAGTVDYLLEIIKKDNDFLVNKFDQVSG